MRREKLYLTDMVQAAAAIARFLRRVERVAFVQDELRQSAVLQKLIVIGEAAGRLPREFCDQHSEIPWADVVGFRSIAVHQYFAVNWEIVWTTATLELPDLREQVARILAEEYLEE
jgi:uncharacterized protein with HEPN domain